MTKKQLEFEFEKHFPSLGEYIETKGLLGTKVAIKSFFFSQIDKILDEIVPEELEKDNEKFFRSETFGFNSCRKDILNKIKIFYGHNDTNFS